MNPTATTTSAKRTVTIAALLLSAAAARAASYSATWTSGFTAGGVVPDGNAAGWFDTRALNTPANEVITDVNVSLTLGAGWNGDLYAFLSHSSLPGTAILLNRPGRAAGSPLGYGDGGLRITFDDAAAVGDIHTYQSASGYATLIGNGSPWQPDGRNVSPFTVNGTEARSAMLDAFNNTTGQTGTWTLFVADLVSGEQSTVQSWGLQITTTIPEPGPFAAIGFAGALGALWRRRARQS